MITIGPYTFANEAERKADYRRRVGPLKVKSTWGARRAYLERV